MLCAVNLMWGSTWVVSKFALREMSPLQLGGWRAVVAGGVLTPILARALRRGTLPPGALPALAMLGFLAFVGAKALNYWGVNLSTGLNASLLTAVEPLLTIALARLWLGEALTGRKLWGLALGGAGAYLLIARGWRPPDFTLAGVEGDLLFVAGLGLEALYSVWGKSILRRYSPLDVTAGTIVTAAVIWIPVLAIDGAQNGWPTPGWVGISAVIYMALGCTVVAYLVWLYALTHMEVGVAAMTILLQPLFGALLSMLLLGERLPPAAALGGALVVLSLFVVSRSPAEAPAT
jgi:drug/metabolite transporter (DMT)-like permease